jgi:hypothetical protein
LLIWTFAVPTVFSQTRLAPELAQERPVHWIISSTNYYSSSKFTGHWYPNTTLGLTWVKGAFRMGTTVNLNQRQNFTFQPPRLIIEVEDIAVQFADTTRFNARPEFYDIDVPVRVFTSYSTGNWELSASLAPLIQSSEIERAELGVANDSLFFINWVPLRRQKTNLLGAATIGHRFGRLHMRAGAGGVPLVTIGDRNFKHEYRPEMRPFTAATWDDELYQVGAATDFKSWGLNVANSFALPAATDRRFKTSLTFRSGLRGYEFYSLRAELTWPWSQKLSMSLGYDNVWSNQTVDQNHFYDWQRSNNFGGRAPLDSNLPHQSVHVGIGWTIDRIKRAWPLRVLNFRLFQQNIFAAKREFYANNPIATIELFNQESTPVNVHLVLETTGKSGKFRSRTVTIRGNETKSMPLYFYLTQKEYAELATSEQLTVQAKTEDHSRIVATEAIRIYGKHAWDGNTWGLRYFVAPDDPTISARAKQIYLSSLKGTADFTDAKSRFALVCAFIEEFGKSLQYVPDPTISMEVDQVQYPVETYMRGGGDCEDLTVCLASGLMAVGMNAAVVDVRPKVLATTRIPTAQKGAIGHVFVLVDTGIPASFMGELELNEFQAISRKNAAGQSTIWIPVETASLADGFDAAFRDGVRQYYLEVIEKNGVVKGDVHVYDF